MSYPQDIETWRDARLKRLTSPDGWTTLVGLYWLEPGDNRFGSGEDNDLTMDYPGVPARLGNFNWQEGKVVFRADSSAVVQHQGLPVTTLKLVSDPEPEPTLLQVGTLTFYAIRRTDRIGIRVKDSAADTRMHFEGLQYFDIDPAWRLEARFEAYNPMKKIPIINVLGMEEDMASPGAVIFEINSQSWRLDVVLEDGEQDYFVMFGDSTNGKQTYGAGRFLYVRPPVNGQTVIDFNKAYTPPCAFSPFATCPLPPQQNRLPIEVPAGEFKYAGNDH